MKKREFLGAFAGAAALLPAAAVARARTAAAAGPALLTVTGEMAHPNRGPLDPLRDQMMAKQQLAFDKARAFSFADLLRLPQAAIRPTLEYDGQRHRLAGPRLASVLAACGAAGGQLTLRGVDGYAPTIARQEALRLGFIVATHLDGRPMALGGLGPLWMVYEADAVPEMAAKPVDQRFAACPWGLYHIEVRA